MRILSGGGETDWADIMESDLAGREWQQPKAVQGGNLKGVGRNRRRILICQTWFEITLSKRTGMTGMLLFVECSRLGYPFCHKALSEILSDTSHILMKQRELDQFLKDSGVAN